MTYLLHEALLSSLGIKGDLEHTFTGSKFSKVDFELLPPCSGSLINRISQVGDSFKSLETFIEEEQDSPYYQALYESVDNFLDHYRSAVLAIEQDINSGKLTTLTGLIACIEPYQHELEFIRKIVESIENTKPLAMLNKVHEYLIISPPSLLSSIQSFEIGLQNVVINQLNGFIFYHQKLPEIFEETEANTINYTNNSNISFIPKQYADILLSIINALASCDGIVGEIEPPNERTFTKYIASISNITSIFLSNKLKEHWPRFSYDLYSLCLIGRSDYLSVIARKLIQPNVSNYDLNLTLSRLYNFETKIELAEDGVLLKFKLEQPLNLIITQEFQNILSDMFNLFVKLYISELYLNEIWFETKKHLKMFKLIVLIRKLFEEIKEYIIFTINMKSYLIQNLTKDIKDFLKFQKEFSGFIQQLLNLLPIKNNDFLKSMKDFFDSMHELHHLIFDDNSLQTIKDIIILITDSSIKIGKFLNSNKDSNLTQNISELSKCILLFE